MSIQQILYILWRRLWIVILAFLSTLGGAALVLVLVPPRYDAVATASIDPGQADPISGILTGGASTGIMQGNMVALATSNQVALEVVKRLNLARSPDSISAYNSSGTAGVVDINQWMATEILKHEDAKFGVMSNVLSITYKSPSPSYSAQVANAFLSAFIDAAIAAKGASGQQAAQWFDPQIDKLQADLVAARDKLTRFQAEHNLLGPSAQGDSENDQLVAVTADLSRAKADLLSLESQYAGSPEAAAQSNEAGTIDLSTLTALRSNLTTVNADISKLQVEVGAGNPKLVERLSTRKSLLDQIQEQIKSYRSKLADRIQTQKGKVAFLEKAREDEVKRMIDVQAKRDDIASLMREVEFRQAQVDNAAKAEGQARLQSQLSFSNIAIVDKATPPTAVSFPKPILVAVGSVGLGLALGLILALIAEALNRRVRCASDLNFVASVPVLGEFMGTSRKKTRKVAIGGNGFRLTNKQDEVAIS